MPVVIKKYWIDLLDPRKIGTEENPLLLQEPLYLDTARLGLMTPSAQRLHNAFARLAGEPHGLLYFSEFFRDGYDAWPEWLRERHPNLSSWHGVNGLAKSVRRYVGAASDSDVLFASRSASLMRLAAWELATRCKRILTVDLLWPPYRKILIEVCKLADARLTVVRLRHQVSFHRVSPPWITDLVCDAAHRFGARGVVLPAITHRGIRLPVETITDRLSENGLLMMSVVDAAQALGHTPLDSLAHQCDFMIAGAHKWLGSSHPLGTGIGFRGRWMKAAAHKMRSRHIDDPLTHLCCESSGELPMRHGETACLAPLLSAQGALNDASSQESRNTLAARLRNRRRLARVLLTFGWRIVGPRELSANGILLANPPSPAGPRTIDHTHHEFTKNRVLITAYRDKTIRFSLPDRPLTETELARIKTVVASE